MEEEIPKKIEQWETYKILNKIRENIQDKKKVAKDAAAEQSVDKTMNQITIAKRLSMTNTQLNDLLSDGQELITNVRLANERRESNRRCDEDKNRAHLLDDLQHESDEATKKSYVIKSRWPEMTEINDPMELNDRLLCQNKRIQNLMQQKDEIIAELKAALDKANERYNTDQTKQEADIQCLIERIDEQIEVIKTVYLEHLELLHQSIDSQRRTFKLFHSNEWQNLYDERIETETQNLNDMLDRNEKYFQEIATIQLQHEEMNRGTRIKLDRENDMVQLKLQHVKAEIELNTEQLNYNYYVLQKRATENIIVRNKQKSRLIKMRACVAAMRKRIHESKEAQRTEIEKQTQNVLNSYANIKDLEIKMCAFAQRDDSKFQHVWQLHESSANSKLESILMIDKILFEKHLGLHCPKSITCQPKRQNQLHSMQKAIQNSKSECNDDLDAAKEIKAHAENIYFNRNSFSKIFQSITEHITTQTDWILGECFEEVITPIENTEYKRIITIDNIFNALGIHNMENVHLLKEYFLPYASCTQCAIKYIDWNENDSNQINEPSSNDNTNTIQCSQHNHIFANFAVEQYQIPIIIQQFLIDLSTKCSASIVTSNKAIDKFDESATVSRPIDLREIEQFWNDYVNVLPCDLEIIWDAIDNGLVRYLEVLRSRKNLTEECELLRRQNAEIEHLLQQHSENEST